MYWFSWKYCTIELFNFTLNQQVWAFHVKVLANTIKPETVSVIANVIKANSWACSSQQKCFRSSPYPGQRQPGHWICLMWHESSKWVRNCKAELLSLHYTHNKFKDKCDCIVFLCWKVQITVGNVKVMEREGGKRKETSCCCHRWSLHAAQLVVLSGVKLSL